MLAGDVSADMCKMVLLVVIRFRFAISLRRMPRLREARTCSWLVWKRPLVKRDAFLACHSLHVASVRKTMQRLLMGVNFERTRNFHRAPHCENGSRRADTDVQTVWSSLTKLFEDDAQRLD